MKTRCLAGYAVIVTAVLLVVLIDPQFRTMPTARAQRDYSSEYKFTNPILDYENIRMEEGYLYNDKAKNFLESLQQKYGIEFASVYFRDMDNGQWLGINEKEKFASASLIKLPILIALLRESEVHPGLLEKEITITEEDANGGLVQDFPPPHQIRVGETHTLIELAKRMIQESDNAAMRAITRNIEERFRNGVFTAVGVEYGISDTDILVRVKDYAGFFRVLFNASYLTRENSELALEILSHTSFEKGLTAGVPKTFTVSHKFGERTYYMGEVATDKQLHDCGIIYFPQKPYILCVMTRGNDFENQTAYIREVSRYFYEQLERHL